MSGGASRSGRVIGDGAKRAGVKPQAFLDAIRNPTKIPEGVDELGRPFKIYVGSERSSSGQSAYWRSHFRQPTFRSWGEQVSALGGPKRSVRLSPAQRAYLLDADYLPADLRGVITEEAADASRFGGITLEVAPAFMERFQSEFTERLAQVGFDPNYELTREGAMLEQLIDAFFSETTT